MKNFKSSGFKKSGSNYDGRSSFGDGRKPAGRYETGRPSRDNRQSDDKPELFKTTCTTCGKPCEVPFRPDGIKPVLCRDCFAAKNAGDTAPRANNRLTPNEQVGRRPEPPYTPAPRTVSQNPAEYALLVKQLGVVETKVNQILELIKASEILVEALPLTKKPVTKVAAATAPVAVEKKERKPRSVTPAVKKAAVKKKVAKKAAIAKKVKKAK